MKGGLVLHKKQRVLYALFLVVLFSGLGILSATQDIFLLMIALDRLVVRVLPASAMLAPTVATHPCAGPVEGKLPWEGEEVFLKATQQYDATIRMAAYATTPPDPTAGERFNYSRAADLLRGTVLMPATIFSMNEAIGPYTEARGFREGLIYMGGEIQKGVGGGVCKMATTLYNVAILADLPILARKNHSMLVPYANPGQDATVSDGSIDFKFENDTGDPLLIWAQAVDTTLYVAFYGQRRSPEIVWHHEILQLQERPLVRRLNKDLSPGEERVIGAGAEGISVRSWLEIHYADGRTKSRQLGTDWYRPMPRIIEYGPSL